MPLSFFWLPLHKQALGVGGVGPLTEGVAVVVVVAAVAVAAQCKTAVVPPLLLLPPPPPPLPMVLRGGHASRAVLCHPMGVGGAKPVVVVVVAVVVAVAVVGVTR